MNSGGPPAGNDTGNVQKYIINGQTAIDDMVYASLHAQLDNQVLAYLNTVGHESSGNSSSMWIEAMKKCNAVFDDEPDELSESESESQTREDGSNKKQGKKGPSDQEDDDGDDEEIINAESLAPSALLQLPKNLAEKVSNVGKTAIGHLRPFGIILHPPVQGLITVAAGIGSAQLYDLASVCSLGDRRIIGVIVDLLGPVTAPIYIVKQVFSDVEIKSDDTIFIDEAQMELIVADRSSVRD